MDAMKCTFLRLNIIYVFVSFFFNLLGIRRKIIFLINVILKLMRESSYYSTNL